MDVILMLEMLFHKDHHGVPWPLPGADVMEWWRLPDRYDEVDQLLHDYETIGA